MTIRHCKVALAASASFYLWLVVLNNVTDPASNLRFIHHVLMMDDTFKGNSGMWRALANPRIHHAFFLIIVLWEAVSAAMIGGGAWRLWRARRATAAEWHCAKSLAVAGLTVSLIQWFAAFLSVGGEWFLMWQSKSWNGQEAAFRMFAILGISLVFLCQRDDDLPTRTHPGVDRSP